MTEKLGISGRIARLFLDSELTPLLGITALLLGLFAVAVTPREEEPQINVTMANVIVPFPGASAEQVESLVATPMERVLAEISGVKHIYSGVASRRRRAHRAVRGRRGAHRRDRAPLQRHLLEPGLAAARRRRAAAAREAQGHRRRAHPQPDAVDAGPGARRARAAAGGAGHRGGDPARAGHAQRVHDRRSRPDRARHARSAAAGGLRPHRRTS